MPSEVHRRAFLQLLALAGAGSGAVPALADAGTGFPLVSRGKAATIVHDFLRAGEGSPARVLDELEQLFQQHGPPAN